MIFTFTRLHSTRAYWATILLFGLANLWSWLRHRVGEPECCDLLLSTGFPFPFHVSGGIAGRSDFLLTGLLLDIVLGWTLAVTAAWVSLSVRNRDSGSAGQRTNQQDS